MKKNTRKTRSIQAQAEPIASQPVPAPIATPAKTAPAPEGSGLHLSWRSLLIQTLLAAYAYAFMEWLFFATKPSFLDALRAPEKNGGVPADRIDPCRARPGAFRAAAGARADPRPDPARQVFPILAALVPALLLAAMSLLLIDNFTYTVFHFGIVTSQGALRAGYAVLAVVLLILWYRQVLLNANVRAPVRARPQAAARPRRPEFSAANVGLGAGLALAGLSIVLGLVRLFTSTEFAGDKTAAAQRQPHIVLLGGDGTDAKWMSLYGYSRKTTPNLDRLAETGLLAENNFTNAAHTTGSVVLDPDREIPRRNPPALLAQHPAGHQIPSEHLPGILQRAGYTTVQIAFPYYIDAYDSNMQDAFDEVNGRSLEEDAILPPRPQVPLGGCRVFSAAAFRTHLRPAAAHLSSSGRCPTHTAR